MADTNIIKTPIGNGITIISAIKNRNEHLKQTLPTWATNPNINEIIIIDWDSIEDVESIINKYRKLKKIVYVKVKNEIEWILSYAYNLAINFASNDKILKLDSDIKLNENFFKKHDLQNNEFYTGRWELARNRNEVHLNGAFFAFRKDLLKVNGYDERILCYGWDDSDLYERLINIEIDRKNIQPDFLSHIAHEDAIRIKYQNIENEYKNNLLDLTLKNRDMSLQNTDWGTKSDHTIGEYSITKIKDNHYECIRKKAKLFLDVKGTLKERIRDYLIAKKMCEDGRRDLILIWQSNKHCEFEFSHFFKNDIEVMNKFDMNLFDKNIDFHFFNNAFFTPREINILGNRDILFRSNNGFFYDHNDKKIHPLTSISTNLKQSIKKNFDELKPTDNYKKNFNRYLFYDLLNVHTPTEPKIEATVEKTTHTILSNQINNYDYLVKQLRKNLKNHIEQTNKKSLILNINGSIESTISAILCKKVCNELNIPLIGRNIIIDDDDNNENTHRNNIGTVFCTEYKKVFLESECKLFYRKMKNENSLKVRTNVENDIIRMANIKARLRMIYLYDLAKFKQGLVISTINYTDFLTGCWTLYGDVGDYNLLKALWKNEIYNIGRFFLKNEIRKPREKNVLIKFIKSTASNIMKINKYFSNLKIKSYEEAEKIFKDFFNGHSELNDHPLIKKFKENHNQEYPMSINRSELINTSTIIS